ncbi:glycosyltransferase family 2 protein [Micromonospora sp. WMMD882]|uniref:glycosyltransferase family 2 protein n=1 Tax=Micromonospora sp. WMMD882 TaxID=3015151 RepID=UPI00248B5F7F|nr:glycosyltransferase family 2 protein [Micromonospora sp. WMMD882]WBB79423.1 glycosyltransferase family 2 protein [Micromonospora sp. WMMD882]
MSSAEPISGRPRLSVVVPVHGVEAYLATCLDSILAEAADDVEVVAVDDASPDGCGAILDGYAAHDPRVRVVRLTDNVGLGGARNAGLDRATGEHVWFVDADDWLPPGSLTAVRDRLAATRPDVLLIDHAEVFPDGRVAPRPSADALGGRPTPLRLADRPQLLRLAQSACTKIVRRELLDATGLRFRGGWYEDVAYSHPLLMAAASIDVLERVCYHYRQQPQGRITVTRGDRHFEVFDQYAAVFAAVDAADGRYDVFRPELFRLMVNHYLVIVGNESRLPDASRRAFFRRAAEDCRRWLPPGGYPTPGGVAGVKHRLIRRDSYPAWAALRSAHRTVGRLRRSARPTTPQPAGTAESTSTAEPAGTAGPATGRGTAATTR